MSYHDGMPTAEGIEQAMLANPLLWVEGLSVAIQASISKIGFDYWGWAVEKLGSKEFNVWLKDVLVVE